MLWYAQKPPLTHDLMPDPAGPVSEMFAREVDHVDGPRVARAVERGRRQHAEADLARELGLQLRVRELAAVPPPGALQRRDDDAAGGRPRQDGLVGPRREPDRVVLLEPRPVRALRHVGVELRHAGL